MKDHLKTLIDRLSSINIELKCAMNVPWIYLEKINGVWVEETHNSEHGWVIAMYPIREGDLKVKDRRELFELIRKYINKELK